MVWITFGRYLLVSSVRAHTAEILQMTESEAALQHVVAGDLPPVKLPRVVLSSVVRSSHQGESHGGVYLVDFATRAVEQLLDWDDPSISWEGRGADRGLRGISFHGDRVFLAASDEIFVYDRQFRMQGSFRNPYLKHCHEITVDGDRLLVTSTGYDSVLQYDLTGGAFTDAFLIRYDTVNEWRRRLAQGGAPVGLFRPMPRLRCFDPTRDGGPGPGDTTHVNNVAVDAGVILVCGTKLARVVAVSGDRPSTYARVPFGSHNAQPFRDGILMNHTRTDRICYVSRSGRVLRSWPIVRYGADELEHASLSADQARQAFGRGLAILDGEHFVGGSSPATVSLYAFEQPEPVATINLTRDVRNAVHGLEVWPF
jgi:hypothetical protein